MFLNNIEASVVFLFTLLQMSSLNLAIDVAHFIDLLPLVKHCSFVTVRPNNIDSYTQRGSYQLLLEAQQNYGSTEINFVVQNEFSLESISLGLVPIAKRWFSLCTIWIQYGLAHIPFEYSILKPDVFIYSVEIVNEIYHDFGPPTSDHATWLKVLTMYFPAMTILAEAKLNSELEIVCLYCSDKQIRTYPLFTSQLSSPLHLVENYNYETASGNLNGHPVVGIAFEPAAVYNMFRKQSCYSYPKLSGLPESVCTFYTLAKHFNYTYADPASATGVLPAIQPASIAIFRKSWNPFWPLLSYGSDTVKYSYMSISLHHNITLNEVYFDPLLLSTWVAILIYYVFVSLILTWLSAYNCNKYRCLKRFVENLLTSFKNLLEQPIDSGDVKGSNSTLRYAIIFFACLFTMHINHTYKANVFSGANFQINTEFPGSMEQVRESPWQKFTSDPYFGSERRQKCLLLFLLKDENNTIKSYSPHLKDSIACIPGAPIKIISYLVRWAAISGRVRRNGGIAKQTDVVLIEKSEFVRYVETPLEAAGSSLRLSEVRDIPEISYSNYWSMTDGTVYTLVNKGLQGLSESGLKIFWQCNFKFLYQFGVLKHIGNGPKQIGQVLMNQKIKNAYSYILSKELGFVEPLTFEPIPKEVYRHGMLYILILMGCCVLIFVFEVASSKDLSLSCLKEFYSKFTVKIFQLISEVCFWIFKKRRKTAFCAVCNCARSRVGMMPTCRIGDT